MTPNDILRKAYDPERFREQGHDLIDRMADALKKAQSGDSPAIRYQDPSQAWNYWTEARQSSQHPVDLLEYALEEGVQLHSPRYMGHQISPPVPITALAGLVNDFMNNGMGVYEMGGVGVTLERLVCQIVGRHLGFTEAADGILTSGGTLANLTALLTARSVKAPEPVWTKGHRRPLALLVSEQAHYCVDRAVRIMGWGEGGIIKVPCDEQYRMRTELLEDFLAKARKEGKEVIAVVGSACSTATGAFDNLEAIADFCERNDLWLHVDGAHGAATAFSGTYRHLVRGIERADSVAMDFHKMLLTPAIATALIYKEGNDAYKTFAQRADYLWEESEDPEWFNLAKRTFECTKAMYSLKWYSLYQTYGPELLDQYVSRVIDTTRTLARHIEKHPHFELAIPPQCNIICFRYVNGQSPDQLNDLNRRIRRQLLEDGTFYIVQTQLDGTVYLRCTLSNPFTDEEHLEGLLALIKNMVTDGGSS
jgi:L-2,4-diaminobutyrate decarboxylase